MFHHFLDYLCIDLADLIEIRCINFGDPLGINHGKCGETRCYLYHNERLHKDIVSV